jgi:hypothetical protein
MVNGQEYVYLTSDAGGKWADVTGNLLKATNTVYKARPAGLLIVPFPGQVIETFFFVSFSNFYPVRLSPPSCRLNTPPRCPASLPLLPAHARTHSNDKKCNLCKSHVCVCGVVIFSA